MNKKKSASKFRVTRRKRPPKINLLKYYNEVGTLLRILELRV